MPIKLSDRLRSWDHSGLLGVGSALAWMLSGVLDLELEVRVQTAAANEMADQLQEAARQVCELKLSNESLRKAKANNDSWAKREISELEKELKRTRTLKKRTLNILISKLEEWTDTLREY